MSTSNNTTEAPTGPSAEVIAMAEYKAGARKREPTHPGKIVASALAELRPPLSVRQAAIAMGVTPMGLGKVTACKSAVSPEMALRLGAFFDNGAEVWLGMQADYDLWHARVKLGAALAKIKPVRKAA